VAAILFRGDDRRHCQLFDRAPTPAGEQGHAADGEEGGRGGLGNLRDRQEKVGSAEASKEVPPEASVVPSARPPG